MKTLLLALSALSLVAGSAPALAAPCEDSHGKFVKCPAPPEAVPQRPGPFRCLQVKRGPASSRGPASASRLRDFA